MQTAMQAKIVESLKTFEYEGRTYDMEHISNRLLENVEEEMNRLLENVEEEIEPQRPASRKRSHHDSVGGAGGLGATSTSISKLLLSLNSINL
jgi:signal recognition particle GTPase